MKLVFNPFTDTLDFVESNSDPNVAAIAALTGTGLLQRNGDGDWTLIDPASLGGGVERDTTQTNMLSYTTSNDADYTYLPTYNMSKIRDGDLNVGMVVTNAVGNVVYIVCQFAQPVYINQLQLNNGQFNGPYNGANQIQLYAGTDKSGGSNFLYQSAVDLSSLATQSFDLTALTALNTPVSNVTIRLTRSTETGFTSAGNISVNELKFLGQPI
jgi:hypothetical protein